MATRKGGKGKNPYEGKEHTPANEPCPGCGEIHDEPTQTMAMYVRESWRDTLANLIAHARTYEGSAIPGPGHPEFEEAVALITTALQNNSAASLMITNLVHMMNGDEEFCSTILEKVDPEHVFAHYGIPIRKIGLRDMFPGAPLGFFENEEPGEITAPPERVTPEGTPGPPGVRRRRRPVKEDN